MIDYFSGLYKSQGTDVDPIISKVNRKISDSQNELLLRLFEAHEIKNALFSMHLDKSPGPDGMNPGFYQSLLDIVGSEITTTCLQFLNNCLIPSTVLIPKKGSPGRLSEMRPIALCNGVYKIVSKAIRFTKRFHSESTDKRYY